MEKIFKSFLDNRKENDTFGPEFRASYRQAERDGFFKAVKELETASFGLTSFMHDLKKISDDGKFEGGEYNEFKKALLDKEKEKIEAISDKSKLPKEGEELTKLKNEHLIDDSEYNALRGVIGQQVVNITNGSVKPDEKDKDAKKLHEKFKEFTKKPKEKRRGCGCFTLIFAASAFIATLWIANALLQHYFPDKKAKARAVQFQKAPAPKPPVPVDTIIGYDKMKTDLASTLNEMKPLEKKGMERALKYIMLAQAQRTATGADRTRIDAEIRSMGMDKKNPVDYAAIRFDNEFDRQGFSRIVQNESDARPGEKVITYLETIDAAREFYAQRMKEVNANAAKATSRQ